MKLVGHPMTGLFDHCVEQLEVSRFLAAIAEVDFSCIHASEKNKHATWIQLKVSVTDLKCVFFFFRYCGFLVNPNVPLFHWLIYERL